MGVKFDPPLGIWKSQVIEMAHQELDKGLKATAEGIRRDAQYRAPYVTGKLHDSIKIHRRKRGYKIKASVPYARRIEFGWVTSKGTQIGEQPYLRPALYEAEFIKE